MIGHPGLIYEQVYEYEPRWTWGTAGTVRVLSSAASENIPPGVLVQIVPGTIDQVRIARDLTRIVGISAYNPKHFSPDVIYNQYDVLPVVRRGAIFVLFDPGLSDFSPAPLQDALVELGAGMGAFTADATRGVSTGHCVFSIASKDYYSNGDGSPAQDIPFPQQAPPPGITNTVFGGTCALVEVNF